MARGKKFDPEFLNNTRSALDKVAPKPKRQMNLKQLIQGLKSRIKRLRNWDYSWSEITELLNQQGIEISEDTLKGYLKTSRRQKLSGANSLNLLQSQSSNLSPEQVEVKTDTATENISDSNPEKEPSIKKESNQTKEGNSKKRKTQPKAEISSQISSDSTVESEQSTENDYKPVKLTMRK